MHLPVVPKKTSPVPLGKHPPPVTTQGSQGSQVQDIWEVVCTHLSILGRNFCHPLVYPVLGRHDVMGKPKNNGEMLFKAVRKVMDTPSSHCRHTTLYKSWPDWEEVFHSSQVQQHFKWSGRTWFIGHLIYLLWYCMWLIIWHMIWYGF